MWYIADVDKEHGKALEQVQEDAREVRHEHIFVGSSQRRPSLDVHKQFQTGKGSQSIVTRTMVEKVVSEDRDCKDFNVAKFPAEETEDYQRSPSPVMYYKYYKYFCGTSCVFLLFLEVYYFVRNV